MLELSEDLTLVPETLQDVVGIQSAPNEFDRHFLAVGLVGPFREIDGAQPAASDLAHDPVGAQLLPRPVARIRKQFPRNRQWRLFDKLRSFGVGSEQGLYLRSQFAILAAFPLEKARPLRLGQLDGGVEERVDSLPMLTRPGHRLEHR